MLQIMKVYNNYFILALFTRLRYYFADYITNQSLYIGIIFVCIGIIYAFNNKIISFKKNEDDGKVYANGKLIASGMFGAYLLY